jgi:hypothetical protein
MRMFLALLVVAFVVLSVSRQGTPTQHSRSH